MRDKKALPRRKDSHFWESWGRRKDGGEKWNERRRIGKIGKGKKVGRKEGRKEGRKGGREEERNEGRK